MLSSLQTSVSLTPPTPTDSSFVAPASVLHPSAHPYPCPPPLPSLDVLDAACISTLAEAAGDRYGAWLATDGDPSTYWMSVGAPDAVLTIDLAHERTVTGVTFNWEAPVMSVLVLYTTSATSDTDWLLGASVLNAQDAPTAMSLSDGGANAAQGVTARRLRLYLRDPISAVSYNASLPMIALREFSVESCLLAERVVTAVSSLTYKNALSPIITSVSPNRGSTAGGTSITLQVEGLPSDTAASDVVVSVVGLPCAVTSVSATEVVCLTSSHGVTSAGRLGKGAVDLTVAAVGRAAASSNATYQYIDLWSRYTTWGSSVGGADGITRPGIDTEGESVWIQVGQNIWLKNSCHPLPPRLPPPLFLAPPLPTPPALPDGPAYPA